MFRDLPRLAEVLALAAVFCAPLALGAVHPPVTLALAALGWLAAACLAAEGRSLRIGLLPLLLFGICLVAALQLLPLPPFASELLAPKSHALWLQAGVEGWHPLSLDPAATAIELAKGLGLVCTVLVLQQRASASSRARKRVLFAIALSAFAVALVGIGHFLAGENQQLLGLFRFSAPRRFLSPFGNTNHAAGFLAAGALVSLGLAVHETRRRPLFLASFFACVAGAILTASRGGVTALAAGLLVLPALGVGARARKREGDSLRGWLIFAGASAGALLLAWWIYDALPRLFEELLTAFELDVESERGKIEAWTIAWRAALFSPLAGVGRGAFTSLQAIFLSEPWRVTFTHAENEALQALAELGFFAGGLFVLGILAAFVGLLRRGRLSWREAGAAAAALALLAQNLVDFSLQYAAGLVLLALLAYRPRRTLRLPALPLRAFAIAAPLLLFGCGLLGLPGLDADREALALRGVDAEIPLSQLEQKVNEAFAKRPGDWLPAEVAAQRALQEDPAKALPWIGRMLKLAPTAGRAHLLAGEAFAKLGRRSQALGEFRQAASLGEPSMERVLAHFPDRQDVLAAVPLDAEPRRKAAQILSRKGRLDEAVELLSSALRREPDDLETMEALAELHLRRKEYGEGEKLASRLLEQEPEEWRHHARLARVQAGQGQLDEAHARYEEALPRFGNVPELVLGHAELQLRRKEPDLALQLADRLSPAAPQGMQTRRHWLRARAFREKNELLKARDELRLCVSRSPTNVWYAVTLADVLLQLGDIDAAEAALPDAPAAAHVRKKLQAAQEKRRLQLEELDRLRLAR